MPHIMAFLLTEVWPELQQDIPTVAWNETWFQSYGVPAHFHMDVFNNLEAAF